jgi:hypothetical protein
MSKAVTSIMVRIGGPQGLVKRFNGRFAWTLDKLVTAGPHGVTPLDQPAPRWSHYVFVLRREGVPIDTIKEIHGGPFSGRHARYVLRGPVEILDMQEAA